MTLGESQIFFEKIWTLDIGHWTSNIKHQTLDLLQGNEFSFIVFDAVAKV